ncbi:MAG: U32 family peptidase [Rhodospirillales bacterium]|jgi:O2-independent ubiquinone biosynthesis protein UbiV|nr:U32 family peptidase [Rhodospirillales bacterium]
MKNSKLTLGPVMFNWKPEEWRDFYFRMADESCVDTVCVGEVVCSKREPFFTPLIPEIVERLQQSGKEVVLSTLALIMSKRDMTTVRDITAMDDILIEANDVSALSLLKGKPHVIGPFANIYNEGTLGFLSRNGATRIALPVELSLESISSLAANRGDVELEVFAYGRLPLAISARCYHARSHGLTKDSCLYVCDKDVDGMDVDTLDGDPFLVVNGLQTLSYNCNNFIHELPKLAAAGISHFRLSPHSWDMVKVAQAFRDVLDGKIDAQEADDILDDLSDGMPSSNGYLYGREGMQYTDQIASGDVE